MSGDYEGMEQQMLTQLERAEKAEAERDAAQDTADVRAGQLNASRRMVDALQAKLDRVEQAADLAATAYGGPVAELADRIRKIIRGEA